MELAAAFVALLLSGAFAQIDDNNCVIQMTCLDQLTDNPLNAFKLYEYVYGIPSVAILGIYVGIINAAIYLNSRSASMLTIVGTYSLTAVGATWTQSEIAPQYEMALYVVAFALASTFIMFVLKLLRE
jgi:hypothetical protein